MPANELKPGMKCYAKQLSIHIDGNELSYRAPRGTKFAVIIMNAEKPDNAAGISANDFIRDNGWSHESDEKSDSDSEVEPETAACPGCGKRGESNQKDGGFYCYGSDRCCP